MKRILIRFAIFAIIQLCQLQWACARAGDAVIPYKSLAEIFQPIANVDQSKLEVQVFVWSTNKAEPPSDIRLRIQSAARGMIPVQLSTNGQILKFPLEKDLLRENPNVAVNQPKGTVRLFVKVGIPIPDALTFRYSRLGDGIAELNKDIRAQCGFLLSMVVPKVRGVILVFPKGNARQGTVEIFAASGPIKYTAGKNGRIRLRLNASLQAENPEVKLSEKLQSILPDME